MSDKNYELLLNFYSEHCIWARHHESQRALVGNLIISISGILVGIIAFDDQINETDAVLSIFITALGLFGAFFSFKHYSQFKFHDSRVDFYKKQLYSLLKEEGEKFSLQEKKLDEDFYQKGGVINKLRLHVFWSFVHIFVFIFGLFMVFSSVLS